MTFHNRTRVSASIPEKLRREGRWYLLPLYRLLTTSYLGREAVASSGSWRFADHIYCNQPSGRYGIGVIVDFVLLHLAPARAFRTRYQFARDRAVELITATPPERALSILSVPCGIPRDLIEATSATDRPTGTTVYGLDLDSEPMQAARDEIRHLGLEVPFEFIEADAFDASAYPTGVDMVISTGFGEFLDDELFQEFLARCRDALAPGGTLVITASARNRLSDFLLRVAEVFTHYRSSQDLRDHLSRAGFGSVTVATDRTGLQTHATARKESA